MLAVALGVLAASPAAAGHELAFYPSFYPQEIRIEMVDPAAAAGRLARSDLHAYVGADPFAGGPVPKDVTAVESLASFVVVTLDPGAAKDRAARCALADKILAALAARKAGYVFHPYPVTPYHADYLAHFDRAEAARKALVHHAGAGGAGLGVALRARGPVAEKLVAGLAAPGAAGAPGASAAPGATVEQIDLESLLSTHRVALNGWLGPPWLKQGWYQAYLLESGAVTDPETKRTVATLYHRLVSGGDDGLPARLDLERKLVAALGAGCERVVAGYTVKREYTSSEYSKGVENVGWDSQFGLDSPIFVRTVKLKDFPWNGWLRVGITTAPAAAWNPIGGFTDPAGRLIWAALGDPAFIPAPRSASWLANRTETAMGASAPGGIAVPADAVLPVAGTGVLRKIGVGKRARARFVYRVREGAFHDGTRMTVPDVLYALGFAYRWGAAAGGGDHDAGVAAATELLRARLVGFRVVKVETIVKKYSDIDFIYDVPVVEVYVDAPATDPAAATVAAPWSALPWHVLALMEEAVRRGLGAFSREEAARRGVPWLDVVRDARTREALARLVDEFQSQGYVPPALRRDVTVDDARARWAALKRFYQAHGHFLVTNGPYRLDKWSADTAVLGVFRDLNYPIGVGTYDEYAIPLRAYVRTLTDRGDRLEIRADVERLSKFARSYEIVRQPLGPERPGVHEHAPRCRYVVLTAGGGVVRAGDAPHDRERVFRVDLAGLPPGAYTVMLALELEGNATGAPITVVKHDVGTR